MPFVVSVRYPSASARASYPPDALVHIGPDGKIVVTVNRCELGQGVATALPMILADEMDADWSADVAEVAPAADVYKDPVYGLQNTGGSATIANSYQQYRELGAKTRAMLIAVAADRWQVKPGECTTASSVVYGRGGQSARYSELAADAARQSVPWLKGKRSTTISNGGLPKALSSPCRPSRLKGMPMVRHTPTLRPTQGNSQVDMRTRPSQAASGITCPRKRRGHLPRRSSMSTVIDVRAMQEAREC